MAIEQTPQDRPQVSGDWIIRGTRISDAEALADLTNLPGFRAGTLRLPHQTPDQLRKRLDQPSGHGVNLVAVLDGRIVGHADLSRFSGRRAHAATLGMGVHDDYRNRGIGGQLLAELVDAADNWLGLTRLELVVYAHNAAAISLYRRHGFEQEGTHPSYAMVAGKLVDAVSMARLRL